MQVSRRSGENTAIAFDSGVASESRTPEIRRALQSFSPSPTPSVDERVFGRSIAQMHRTRGECHGSCEIQT